MNTKSEFLLYGLGILTAILLRCGVSLHPYSGAGKPPMYGDYEAQRHWMEITVNLPITDWYRNTSTNDLQYWGLDYPPLTAYHSYLCGVVSLFINPEYVSLTKSRGYETEEHKLFMRYTVLLVDLLLFIPAAVVYFKSVYKKNPKKSLITPSLGTLLTLLYPGLILIDHGHFQYNCVSLAFAVYAILFVCTRRPVLGSICFCLALNYKQMELYHAIPFFVYLLSTCIPKPGQSALVGVTRLAKISGTVILTFAVIWAPFLINVSSTFDVLRRLFPVARGIFEDKVANVWCTLNVFYKLKLYIGNEQMFRYCTVATFVAVLPSSIDLFLRPNVKKFVIALINSSLAFFLFSFQVHEKTILVVALPVMLYLPVEPIVCFWFLILSVFSMVPLLLKDELMVATISLVLFYIVLFYIICEYRPGCNNEMFFPRYDNVIQLISDTKKSGHYRLLLRTFRKHYKTLLTMGRSLLIIASLSGCALFVALILIFHPPMNYPDLFSLIISIYSCFHFLAFFIYFNFVQFNIPPAVEDIKHFKFKSD
ncbi:dolichyl pyrophosphate Man9GlcNAc2 alpha-1,3-glucosyltransferase [Photinus pyralis]|uniref:dolichyl pyrophosphate Man9GlcNAc2 alpha-1,3-glucosyltransferase n=1 Tax=Photinus pyralis TaxID=7054 RepID=UPI00126752A2|nr:dolichyl pyrophosphate Man9GlcNAc2 alpha-1,3-glucosyltransferase [Photinus pyralis]